ncbi:MAG: VOC family protein [Gammaproteobacteria bacterium]|jgi:catechol 2,3-dioxygenase-like lactoylglutathione lyase family enzyme
MKRPDKGYGMRHVALFVRDLPACEAFYTDLLGFEVEYRPNPQNVYLTTGCDNLALHQTITDHQRDEAAQRLEHIGIFVRSPDDVDLWYRFLVDMQVPIRSEPRTNEDGTRSFHCYDPDSTVVQIMYHPPADQWEQLRGVN